MSYRKIQLNNETWLYVVGKKGVKIRSPQNKVFWVEAWKILEYENKNEYFKQISIKDGDLDSGSFTPPIKPKNICNYILRNITTPCHGCKYLREDGRCLRTKRAWDMAGKGKSCYVKKIEKKHIKTQIINKYEMVMYQLKGNPPGYPYKPRHYRFMRRACSFRDAERANELYAELGWTERWVREKE